MTTCFRVEVLPRQPATAHWLAEMQQLGLTHIQQCYTTQLYFIEGDLTSEDVQALSHALLVDNVVETFTVLPVDQHTAELDHVIEITLLPGVTDPVAENLVHLARALGYTTVQRAATGQQYALQGALFPAQLHMLATELFSNPVIQRYELDRPIAPPLVSFQPVKPVVEKIALTAADDERLRQISSERRLALNVEEMQAIRAYYQAAGREPTDVELEMLAQTWSEHCVHKTFKASVHYTEKQGEHSRTEIINGILKTYIRRATEDINKPWVHSAFVDNAGIIAFDERWDIAFKVETHNHPSALEPFGGANTGLGGVIRDVLGVSARPIANTDVLCFGPQNLADDHLPAGVLHPRRVMSGVVHGIEDYGNKMGIPTVNGAILYHPGYTANPLVFCGSLGILPRNAHRSAMQAGDLIVVLGGRTGRDGLRGATFSSMEMDQETGNIAGSAVQIGHPINEKQVLEVVLRARDEQLYTAITDCGAGGLSSAVGEMAGAVGARVQLQDVPLKYPGLQPWEIWLSEAQERMVMAVPPGQWARLQALCAAHDVEAVNIGEFISSGRLQLFYGDWQIADLDLHFLHDGIPQRELQAVWEARPTAEPNIPAPADLHTPLLQLLAHPNIASKEPVIRRYDHEVQGSTAVKPLVGQAEHGPGDAAVLVPLDTNLDNPNNTKAVALSAGICPAYGEHDPYLMAWAAIDEALRNAVAVGADPDQIAILDNFCWGNPNLPDRMGSLVRCSQGCYDAAIAYQTPFISGKDSLNNEYADETGQRHAIPGTLLISAVGRVPDVRQTVTMDLKAAGNRLYVLGATRHELGGSHYALLHGSSGGAVPQPVEKTLAQMRGLHQAIRQGVVQACHDCSEGGIGVALAEMCLAGRLGAEISTVYIPGDDLRDDVALFSESLSRFIVEVRPEDADTFEDLVSDFPYALIGTVEASGILTINGREISGQVAVAELEKAWRGEQPVEAVMNPPAARSQPRAFRQPVAGQKRVLILHANGTNRDRDAALACQLAGGLPEIVQVDQLLHGERHLADYHMLIVPGGFSYGDDLGAGKLWAVALQHQLGDQMQQFVASGRPVLGICNGFQVLVKAGLLPGDSTPAPRTVTLTYNASGHFECRWVYLQPNPHSPSLFTEGLTDRIYCPVAHGEGRLVISDEAMQERVWQQNLATLTYVDASGQPVGYPGNPNGSLYGIAGLCNPAGNVMGLMPHPEDHVFPWQHPRWHRGESGLTGLKLFENGIKYA